MPTTQRPIVVRLRATADIPELGLTVGEEIDYGPASGTRPEVYRIAALIKKGVLEAIHVPWDDILADLEDRIARLKSKEAV